MSHPKPTPTQITKPTPGKIGNRILEPKIKQDKQARCRVQKRRARRQALLQQRMETSVQAADEQLLPLVPQVVEAVGSFLDGEDEKVAPSVIQIIVRYVHSPSNRHTLRSKLQELIQAPSETLAFFNTDKRRKKSDFYITADSSKMLQENAAMAINGNGKGSFFPS